MSRDQGFVVAARRCSLPVISAIYELTTPLFGGGAVPETSPPEVRVPSFKGVLRWWWRALAWSRYECDLRAIQRAEERLFGSATTGRSRVLLRVSVPNNGVKVDKRGVILSVDDGPDSHKAGPGVRYLGYGLVEAVGSRKRRTEEGELLRPCLREGIEVGVEARLRDLDDEDDVELLRAAFVAMGTMGGLGARSRRGFGSLSLKSLTGPEPFQDWDGPETPADLTETIRSLIPDTLECGSGSPPTEYSALTPAVRFVVAPLGVSGLALLNDVGEEMMRYRSWGRNGRVLGEESERNFRDDHDLMDRAAKGSQVASYPRRAVFGLPHNYYFSSTGRGTGVKPAARGLDRRASPLLIHVHALPPGRPDRFVTVATVLPSVFLPAGRDRISVGSSQVSLSDDPNNLYLPLLTFLQRLGKVEGPTEEEPG